MDRRRRIRIGVTGVIIGVAVLFVGAEIAHFTGLPTEDPVTGEAIYPSIPRGWVLEHFGMLIGLVGSQIAVAAFVYGWLLDRPMTWVRAAMGAMIAWLELILIFGVVPSEWLNLAQSELNWTTQRIAFTVPRWLVLNNQMDINYSALKDAVVGLWNVIALGGLIVFAYRWQERGKKAPPVEQVRTSPYGRPLVKGSR